MKGDGWPRKVKRGAATARPRVARPRAMQSRVKRQLAEQREDALTLERCPAADLTITNTVYGIAVSGSTNYFSIRDT